MSEIRLLDSSVINLIAAGEVVDRPASAIKELVENALDAGATHISVEIRKGGLGMIRVTDDGCGMSAENGRRAFLKHATSKIRTEEDLVSIGTLGFRGEALAAIAAVSKITLTTKEAGKTEGVRFELTEGKIESEEVCGCPEGSSFVVRDLFFNTPARLKFMKSEPAETGAVQSVMEKLALSHPSVSFRFSANGTERFQTTGRGDLRETVFSIFGREFADMTLPVDFSLGDVRVFGLVGKPVYSKANRGRQIFFLNGRYVRSPIFTAGLENAYHNKMLIGRVPVCVLFVELPLASVDVNVHPGKLEVKFADENGVAYALRKATEDALQKDNGIVEMNVASRESVAVPEPSFIKPPMQKVTVPAPVEKSAPVADSVAKKTKPPVPVFTEKPASNPDPKSSPISAQPPEAKPSAVSEEKKDSPVCNCGGWKITPPQEKKPAGSVVFCDVVPSAPRREVPPVSVPVQPEIPPVQKEPAVQIVFEEKKDPPASPVPAPSAEEPVLFRAETPFRMIGEAFDCYILVEKGEEILFVDKHALHERMNFERLRKGEIASQSLLCPIVLHLGIEENRLLVEHADFVARFGFMLESFGDDLLIREIPALIDVQEAEPLLQQFAESLALGRDDSLMDRFYYDLACKASIRSGSKTTAPELRELVSEYFRRESELQYCPHGRPIVFSLPKKSIEKQFKRVK